LGGLDFGSACGYASATAHREIIYERTREKERGTVVVEGEEPFTTSLFSSISTVEVVQPSPPSTTSLPPLFDVSVFPWKAGPPTTRGIAQLCDGDQRTD